MTPEFPSRVTEFGTCVAAGRRAFVDQERRILVRHGGFRFETNTYSVDIYHDKNIVPGVLETRERELDLSDKSMSVFSLFFRDTGPTGPQEFGFELLDHDYLLGLHADMLRSRISGFDAAEAAAYRDEIIGCQGLIEAWDEQFRDFGALRNHNTVQSIAFVVPARIVRASSAIPYQIRAGADASTVVISRELVA